MRVLGIDPGYGRVGVAVIDGSPGKLQLQFSDCLTTSGEDPITERFLQLFDSISALCHRYRPDSAAVESLFLVHNQRTAMRVAEARGVILTALAKNAVAVAEYTPTEVKSSVVAFGSADKQQVERMVCRMLGVTALNGTDDTADACALAICHHHRAGLQAALRGASR